ncbi:MAG: 30S ribosomal protein S11 [Chloroflexota bacterium]
MAKTQSTRPSRGKSGRKQKRRLSIGTVHIHVTFNNTIVTVTDLEGNTVTWGSAGSVGFKGSKKSTPFAARLATEKAISTAMDLGLQEVDVYVKGPGPGREAALRSLQTLGLKVRSISDVTPVPHNGCRPPKKRRI